jgi:hypothetical protein
VIGREEASFGGDRSDCSPSVRLDERNPRSSLNPIRRPCRSNWNGAAAEALPSVAQVAAPPPGGSGARPGLRPCGAPSISTVSRRCPVTRSPAAHVGPLPTRARFSTPSLTRGRGRGRGCARGRGGARAPAVAPPCSPGGRTSTSPAPTGDSSPAPVSRQAGGRRGSRVRSARPSRPGGRVWTFGALVGHEAKVAGAAPDNANPLYERARGVRERRDSNPRPPA